MNPLMRHLLEQAEVARRARDAYERTAAKVLRPGLIVEIERGGHTYEATACACPGSHSGGAVHGGRVYVEGESGRRYWVGLSRVRDFAEVIRGRSG